MNVSQMIDLHERDLSLADTYARDGQHQVQLVAEALTKLATRLMQTAPALANEKFSASFQAAEIVSDYVHGVGAVGTRLDSLIVAAAAADKHRAATP